jgi:hypothetical protein
MVGSFSVSSAMMPLGGNGAAVIPSQAVAARGLPLPANPAQGVRRLQTSLSSIPPPPPPPIPEKFQSAAMKSNAGQPSEEGSPLSAKQVIALARDAMKNALKDNESQAAEASAVSTELKPGVTIDLSQRNIEELPEEVVDIIKTELERYVVLPPGYSPHTSWSRVDC